MVSLLNWWYTRGWGDFLRRTSERLGNLADFFSIGLLLKTLFAPFRQISAGSNKSAPLDARLRMALDRLVSRIIGAIVRTFIILAGVIVIALFGLLALCGGIIWPILPLAPLFGLVLTLTGVII